MITAAVFDTKPYDRKPLQDAATKSSIEWRFLDFRLTKETAPLAKNAQAVCVFVNDRVDRPCLEALAAQGVKLVALRCTGFNNVDVAAAKALQLAVTRVPVYSPYSVTVRRCPTSRARRAPTLRHWPLVNRSSRGPY